MLPRSMRLSPPTADSSPTPRTFDAPLSQRTVRAARLRTLARFHAGLSRLDRARAALGGFHPYGGHELAGIYRRRVVAPGARRLPAQFWRIVCRGDRERVLWPDRGVGARPLQFPGETDRGGAR